VAEWLKASVLKTEAPQGVASSNLALSSLLFFSFEKERNEVQLVNCNENRQSAK
jgi:hypothetical protein